MKMNNNNLEGLISVIIPVYNLEKYIKTCLDSVIRNTYTNLEIICVNDGSTDKSQSIIEGYNDNRIILVNQTNQGLSAARNKGLDIAKGDYIAFIDGDDYVHHRYFELLLCAIQNCEISCCNYVRTDAVFSDKPFPKVERQIKSFETAIQDGNIKHTNCAKIYRKRIIGSIRFNQNISFSEDKLFNVEVLCSQSGNIGYIDLPLYLYIDREDSAVTKSQKTNLCIDVYLDLAEQLQHSDVLKEAYASFLSYRYLSMFEIKSNQEILMMKKNMERCIRLSQTFFSISQRVWYNSLLRFPIIYRIIRILKDKSMLEWERNQKGR